MTADPIILIDGVSRSFTLGDSTVEALIDVSARIRPGEVTVIAGPSGSGKTTLLTILAGHETMDAGRITTHPPLPEAAPIEQLNWAYVGYVPQTPALLDELTVTENIELPNRLLSRRVRSGRDKRGPAAPEGAWDTPTLMDGLQIAHLASRYPTQTSGGEQQRTALARALRLAPPLLIADEPTGHQDRARVHLVLKVLKQYARSGRAVVVASHDDEVLAAADSLIRMADGRLEVERALT
jgi:putative ABC transport system ATP-binding protein